ncbi:methionyl-tRNA formyltransferase [Quadrisphaera sp. GCM10027208]|uniref:methionyl-tRNA formyltransferase n=1 Tax=Quadrisphaera sp. GCM10027208 TaxID=3273423 RepID=UPI00361F0EFE
MRLVVAGTPQAAVPSLLALLASRHEVVAVLTRPDARAGRGRRQVASPVKQVALEHGVPVLQPRTLRDDEAVARLAELSPDACPVVGYGLLVPPAALAVPRLGWVNLHFSLLPAWRGAAPVQHAIMAGDDVTGATTFLLDEGLDTGPVLGRLTETVRPRDTAGDLLERLAQAGAGLLVATLDALEDGTIVPEPQPADGVSLAPKITVEDARVDWTLPATAVDRRVRGCTPVPGAWTTFRGERLKLAPLTPLPPTPLPTTRDHAVPPPSDPGALAPGELRADRDAVLVGTGTGPVVLGDVQPAGRRPMPAADWARGVRPEPGERLT